MSAEAQVLFEGGLHVYTNVYCTSLQTRWLMDLIPGRVKQKVIKLVSAASPLKHTALRQEFVIWN